MRNDTERKDLKFYLNLHYPITIHPDPDGGYVAEIEELHGCMTQAETLDEVFEAIEDARQLWIKTTYEEGQDIPLPRDMEEHSGKFMLRIQKDIFLREPVPPVFIMAPFGTEEKSYRYDEIISMERRELTKGRT
jgi:antitoxin HicB